MRFHTQQVKAEGGEDAFLLVMEGTRWRQAYHLTVEEFIELMHGSLRTWRQYNEPADHPTQ